MKATNTAFVDRRQKKGFNNTKKLYRAVNSTWVLNC